MGFGRDTRRHQRFLWRARDGVGVGRQTLSHLVNEKASVSIEMAYRLSKAFGSTPETWLGMQLAFDLAQSRDLEQKIKVERIVAA